LSHTFGSIYAKKPLKGSKDSDHSQDSKKLEPKMVCLVGWGPGPGLGYKNVKTCTHYNVTSENPKSKKKKLHFQSQL